MEREDIEKLLKEKFSYSGSGWLSNCLRSFFDSGHTTEKISKKEILEIIQNFLNSQEVSNLIFFPNSSTGWSSYDPRIRNSKSPITFNNSGEAIKFLNSQIIYGAENYYITNKNMDWFLTISHDQFLEVSGKEEFVEKFKKDYLQ